MGFSFRKKKKSVSARKVPAKKKEAEVEAAADLKDEQNKAKQQNASKRRGNDRGPVRVSSKDFSSPLGTIDETRGDENEAGNRPEATPSVLNSLNVVPTKEPGTYDTHDADESLEVVVGPPGTASTVAASSLDTAKEKSDKKGEDGVTHEDVRKILFSDDQEAKEKGDEKEDEGKKVTPQVQAAASAVPEEQPFDAKAEYEADEMLDLERTLPSDFGRQNRTDMLETNVTKKLLDVFNCNEDTTKGAKTVVDKGAGMMSCVNDMFYDTVCGSYVNGQKRPYYNLQFTLKFLEEATKTGIPLLNHIPPTGPDVEDWTGRSVTMFVRPGSSTGAELIQPTLDWSTLGGGWSRTGTSEVVTTSVDLLHIHAILDSSNIDEEREDDEEGSDMCFFSITTRTGDVHVFETQSYEERDRIVNGLKNIIARLAYHLVAGDVQVSAELYSEDYGEASGELPSLRTPTRAMNDISHSFLD